MSKDVMATEHEEADLSTTINVTPLVDVMLVLLIVFLITIPVVLKTVPVQLPKVTNIPTVTKPQNLVIAVDKAENVYLNNGLIDSQDLLARLKQASVQNPQPEVHIRGDLGARFEAVGRVILLCQRAGIQKVVFVTEPEHIGSE